MKIRPVDRIIAGVIGLMLIALCAALIAQLFFQVDLVGQVHQLVTSDSAWIRILLIVITVLIFIGGLYLWTVSLRGAENTEQFVVQKTENGDLAISLNALDDMVQKCLELHPEMSVQNVNLESRKDGLLIRIRAILAAGISIPLTVEALQKQIVQYVTACSGVEIKGIRVMIESTGPMMENAPFAIALPDAQTALRSGEETEALPADTQTENLPAQEDDLTQSSETTESAAAVAASAVTVAHVAAAVLPDPPGDDEEDDRPMHQRIFSTPPEPCIVPIPPEGIPDEARTPVAEAAAEMTESETREAETREVETKEAETSVEDKTAESVLDDSEIEAFRRKIFEAGSAEAEADETEPSAESNDAE